MQPTTVIAQVSGAACLLLLARAPACDPQPACLLHSMPQSFEASMHGQPTYLDTSTTACIILTGCLPCALHPCHAALHHAAARGHAECVEELWPRGANIEAADAQGRTPLMLAAGALGGFCAEYFFSFVHFCAWHAFVPHMLPQQLHVAGACGVLLHLETCKKNLISCPPLINPCSPVDSGHVEVVSRLIIAGCHVHRADSAGLTASHLAATQGYAKVLEKLLLAGFDVDMPTQVRTRLVCGCL